MRPEKLWPKIPRTNRKAGERALRYKFIVRAIPGGTVNCYNLEPWVAAQKIKLSET